MAIDLLSNMFWIRAAFVTDSSDSAGFRISTFICHSPVEIVVWKSSTICSYKIFISVRIILWFDVCRKMELKSYYSWIGTFFHLLFSFYRDYSLQVLLLSVIITEDFYFGEKSVRIIVWFDICRKWSKKNYYTFFYCILLELWQIVSKFIEFTVCTTFKYSL